MRAVTATPACGNQSADLRPPAASRRGALASALMLACGLSIAAHAQFPDVAEAAAAKAGEVACRPGKYRNLPADFCWLAVPENRTKTGARLIRIPVLRVKASRALAREPVFYLFGGPGASNIQGQNVLDWGYEGFDTVFIGYRGVDGSVSLDCPEFGQPLGADNPLSSGNLLALGGKLRACFDRLARDGVDLAGYNMLEVSDDLESARRALGYGRIHLWAHSYGTTVAYLYARRHPDSVARMLLLGASSPRRVAVWDPRMADKQLRYYGELWKRDPAARERTPDLIAAIRRVLASLPRDWQGARIDGGRIRAAMFQYLYNRTTAALVFDAFVRADQGDWSGLAEISNQVAKAPLVAAGKPLSVGDVMLKLGSYVYEPRRNYEKSMDPAGSLLGSPLGKLTWVALQASGWPVPQLPREWRRTAKIPAEALLLHGTVDFSSPPEYTRRELLPLLPNGKLVLLEELGHNDIIVNQAGAFRRLMEEYFARGVVDRSLFKPTPMDFRVPKPLGAASR